MDLRFSDSAARKVVEKGLVRGLTDEQLFRRAARSRLGGSEWRCWITNDGASVIRPGDMVGIHAMTDSELDSEQAAQNWVDKGIRGQAKLMGNIDDSNSGRLVRAVALDMLEPNMTGRAEAPGAFMAWIWRDPEEFDWTERFSPRADWCTVVRDGIPLRRLAFVRYPGDYAVIDAAQMDDENYLFALLTPSLPGHAAATVTEVDVAGKLVTCSCGAAASCPLMEVTPDLKGKKVILSRGVVNRKWEVIGVEEGAKNQN